MAATNIGSSKYPLAKIPAMADPADIQVALKYYHWGQEAEPEGTAAAGISKYLDDIDTRIDAIDATLTNAVEETVIDAKGDLFVGTSNNNLDNLAVGSDGHILTADSTQGTFGLKWAALPLNNTLTSTSESQAATASTVKTLQDTKSALDFTILEKTANHPLVLSDAYKIIEMNLTSTANTVTIPLNATQAFAIGSQITIIQTGTGATTVVVTAGVTLNCTPQVSSNAAKLRTQYSSCTLIKRATNTWIAIGDLSA
jgi:hypothetical protein